MSSSRIIKSDQLKSFAVCNVNYGALLGNASQEEEQEVLGDFTPLLFSECCGAVSGAEKIEEIVEEPELLASGTVIDGMLVISDEDLQRKLDDAFHRGADEGRQMAERGLANVFKSLREGIAGLTGLREKVLRESEEDLLKLSIMIARKVIQREVTLDHTILANVLSAAVTCCSELERLSVRLHPEDYAIVSGNRQTYLAGVSEECHINLVPDEGVLPGGCIVDTATGTIDARIDVQLEEIFRRFMEERGVTGESPIKLLAED